MDNVLRNKILDICKNNFNYLMNLENINGIGMGYKYVNNCKTLELCLHVLVENKIDTKYLSKNNIVPKIYMGIKTDVIKFKMPKACGEALPNKIRPVEGGYGVSCNNISGTIGCIVTKQIGKRVLYYILSNNHVLAGSNKTPLGTVVIQPSIKDGGNLEMDKIARLNDFVRVQFKNDEGLYPINYVDCAIARLFNIETISDRIAYIGKVKGATEAVEGETVKKVGKITGKTEGEVTTVAGQMKVSFGKDVAVFYDQILANIECHSGDSGSTVLNKDDKVIGLLCAGTSNDGDETYNQAVINKIDRVLDAFKVELYKSE